MTLHKGFYELYVVFSFMVEYKRLISLFRIIDNDGEGRQK